MVQQIKYCKLSEEMVFGFAMFEGKSGISIH